MKNTKKAWKTTGLLLIIILAAALIIHARYGFCQSDETFYTSLTHRLWTGDRLIVDEWHPVQFYSPILLPFYALYRLFVPGGEGVLLYFRIIYILAAAVTSIHFYLKTSKTYPVLPSLLASSLLLLYSRANISGPSYYNLCILFVINGILFTLNTAGPAKKSFGLRMLAGMFFALASVCNPYFAPFVMIGAGILFVRKKTLSCGVAMVSGIAATAILYWIIAFKDASLSEIWAGIINVINEPTHKNFLSTNIHSVIDTIRRLFGGILPCVLAGLIFASFMIVFLVSLHKRNDSSTGLLQNGWAMPVLIIVYFIAVLGYMILAVRKIHMSPCYTVLLVTTACMLPLMVAFWKKTGRTLPVRLYFSGTLVTISFFFASNTGADAMTVGACISSIGIVLMLADILKNEYVLHRFKKSARRILCFAAALILLIMAGASAAHRFLGIYRDAPLNRLNVQLENGPAKGLFTTQANAEQYRDIYNAVRDIYDQFPDERVLHIQTKPWVYLCADWEIGAPTTWEIPISREMLTSYYSMHSDKMPSLVFLYANTTGSVERAPFNNHTTAGTPFSKYEGDFYESLIENGEIVAQNNIFTVYRLN